MERKSDTVRRLVAEGKLKDALRIAKEFHLGINKKDSEDMKMGYECLVHPRFYKDLGLDADKISQQGIETVIRLYGT